MKLLRAAAPQPKLFKYLFGLHIVNGCAVAVGVFATAVAVGWFAGFEARMAAASGALVVSIGDTPSPLAAKLRILPLALVCAVLASLATTLAIDDPLIESAVIVTVGVGAGLLLAWGRWAIPLSVLVMLAMVFTLGAPPADLDGRLSYEVLFALGGAIYIPVALALTVLLDASGRRLTLAEVLREFAAYLRCVAGFYQENPDQTALYLKLLEQQASLSDHLQAARALIAGAGDRPSALRLTAGIAVLLEAFDGVVSAHADQAPLRLAGAKNSRLAGLVAALAMQLAAELEHLALDLTIGKKNLYFPDHQATLDLFAREIARISADPAVDPHLLRAARLTRARFGWVVSHLTRLPAVLTRRDKARKALVGVDLNKFVTPLRVSLAPLLREVRWSSPIFRHALRLGLALGCGYLLILFVPGLRHGNWILLTTAVIMRASYSVTRQRRNERLLGSILGCAIAGALLWSGSNVLLFAVQLAAIGIAHAFVRVDYRVASTAATVMALLGLHLIDPVTAAPVFARLIDTAIGVAIAFVFNLILPQWERHAAPAFARGFVANLALYADHALRFEVPEQDYRLARKDLIEAMAALSESAARMRGEPTAARALLPDYGKLIASAYATAAQIVNVRLLIRSRRDELDAPACEKLLDETRRAVLAELDLAAPPIQDFARAGETPAKSIGGSNAFAALRQRCAEVLRETGQLRRIALENLALA
ncbi:FUSC family membrane protein [uncultured Rhodoblastus sp.]|uniref:FUSC family protein n=1 Tax=uncultured Rhodoblastus sp. TaxID=543037 RepID=UPI0025FBE7E6|nr:FUSC family membrane protein [uncultured Rhodoblastus sp.]